MTCGGGWANAVHQIHLTSYTPKVSVNVSGMFCKQMSETKVLVLLIQCLSNDVCRLNLVGSHTDALK